MRGGTAMREAIRCPSIIEGKGQEHKKVLLVGRTATIMPAPSAWSVLLTAHAKAKS